MEGIDVITVDSHIHLERVTPELAERLIQQFTRFSNPKFEASRRYSPSGRPGWGIPEFIELHSYNLETGELNLPRGLLPKITSMFGYDRVVSSASEPAFFAGQHPEICRTYTPRDYQVEAVDAVVKNGGGVVVAGTGTGKTVIGLELARRLDTPTLFLVHTQSLLNQTIEAVREKLGIEPGVIGGGKWKPDWFTVGMLQTISSRGARELRDAFGLVIMDEAHHCPAETFAEVMQQFTARYRVGLTATPDRKDGLTPILHAVIGREVFRLPAALLPLRYEKIETPFSAAKLPERGRKKEKKGGMAFTLDGKGEKKPSIDYTELMSMLCADRARTAFIVEHVVSKHHGLSLVVTERVAHAEQLCDGLRARGIPAVMLAGDGCNVAVRRDVAEGIEEGRYSVLVSTPGMVGEGFDLPRLDTLFVATPFGDPSRTQQLAGRVLRPHALKEFGMVYDFVDNQIEPLQVQWFKRARVYKKLAQWGAA